MLLVGVACHDGNGESHRQFDVINTRNSRNDVGLFTSDQIFDSLHGARTVHQNLCQREVMRELVDVIGYHKVKTTLCSVDIADLQDFEIVT